MLVTAVKTTRRLLMTALDSLLFYSLRISLPEYLEKDTMFSFPVTDQLANPDPAKVANYYGEILDVEAAKRFGTTDLTKYSYWAWRSCGIALVHTVLTYFKKSPRTVFDIASKIDAKGGYLHASNGQKDIGWKYSALADYLRKEGITVTSLPFLSICHFIYELLGSKFVIASIKSRIGKESSHLVLVSGVMKNKNDISFIIHDPYYLDGKGGKKIVSLKDFGENFLMRGICIK